jgi:hypothetical protein
MSDTRHPLNSRYTNMKVRCYNPSNWAYKWYGAKGIKVCDRWLGKNGFRNFVEDMGFRHTITTPLTVSTATVITNLKTVDGPHGNNRSSTKVVASLESLVTMVLAGLKQGNNGT